MVKSPIVRVTVGLNQRAVDAAASLADRRGLSRTDAVNLGLVLLDRLTEAGAEVFTRDAEEAELTRLEILFP